MTNIKEVCIKAIEINKQIKKINELIAYYEMMSNSINSIDLSSIKANGTRNVDAPYKKWINKKDDAERKRDNMLNELMKLKNDLNNFIETMEKVDIGRVLYLRCIENYKWESISTKMKLSLSTVHRYYKKALELTQ